MRTIFTSMSLLFPFVDLFAALCGNGMLESMLEPHLKYAGASTVDVGVSFLVFGCCYMFGNMLFGAVNYLFTRPFTSCLHICLHLQSIDKVGYPIMFSMLGNILFLVAFLLIGPLPFLKMEPYKAMIQVNKYSATGSSGLF